MRRTAGTSLALFTMVLGLLAAPLAAQAQEAGKVWRIGFLSSASSPGSRSEALRLDFA